MTLCNLHFSSIAAPKTKLELQETRLEQLEVSRHAVIFLELENIRYIWSGGWSTYCFRKS